MILILDNYDSFTYNLYQYIGGINPDIQVYRNDVLEVKDILAMKPSHIVISPGPGFPAEAGICIDVIRQIRDTPILGVCLGHQAIGEAFGGKIIHAPEIIHGKGDTAALSSECRLFKGLDHEIQVGRYHSLVIDPNSLPKDLAITAHTPDGCIMGVQHTQYPVFGIQFHPESVLTPGGLGIINNFLEV